MATTVTPSPVSVTLSLPIPLVTPLSVKQRIELRIGDRLQRVLHINGYQTNLGASLIYGQELDVNNPDLPRYNYYADEETAEEDQFETSTRELAIVVIGRSRLPRAQKNDIPFLVNQVQRDTLRAIMNDPTTDQVEETLGGLATKLFYTGSTPIVGIDPEFFAGARVEFIVEYKTAIGNPDITQEE